jgi:hypothetical protein
MDRENCDISLLLLVILKEAARHSDRIPANINNSPSPARHDKGNG